MDFFKTPMGKKYYESTLPRIADALEKLSKAMEEEPGQEPSSFEDPHVRLYIPDTNFLVVVSLESEGVRINVREVSENGKGLNKTIAKKWRLYDDMASGKENYDDLDCFAMSDQPEECRKCGTRTEFEEIDDEEEKFQLHQCPKCHYEYKLFDEGEDESEE
jgi:predicted Zn-ribbon and HTH transcriptional regulator